MTYSVAVSYFENDNMKISLFPNFYEFFETCFKKLKRRRENHFYSIKSKIQLIAHNNNKYDNHYLRKDILYFYPHTKFYNQHLKNAIDNENTVQVREIKKDKMKYMKNSIFEKRVKSSINLEMDFYLDGVHFVTIDNFVKTGLSIKTIGKKLHDSNLLDEQFLKTDFDYLEFNKTYNMTEKMARHYALEIFYNRLNETHETYIRNDVIILGYCWFYYDRLFPNFDYDKITFTSNILESYLINEKTRYHLLSKIKNGKKIEQVKATEYVFANKNYYDYVKQFYYGGLNFYNQKYLNKVLNEPCFTMDRNSSYPSVMYFDKLPYSIKNFCEENCILELDFSDDIFYIFEISMYTMNAILNRIPSLMIRRMIAKYFKCIDGIISINSNLIKMINLFSVEKIDKIYVENFICYNCKHFPGREKIAEYYFIKSQGKLDKKIVMNAPNDYEILEEENTLLFNEEEIYNAKVKLNGLYGIPALRAYFNLFRYGLDGELENIPNGFKNSERNMIFSVFVTSKSLYDLLQPLEYLTANEIDNNLIYGDTDSLYLKKEVMHKMPPSLFDDISLGKWSIDDDTISQLFVLNHKKYCYYSNKKEKIILKCGGIPLDSFNLEYDDLNEFVKNEFHNGVVVKNQRSIYTEEKQIAIYSADTVIEKGGKYPSVYSDIFDKQKKEMIEEIEYKMKHTNEFDDVLYFDTVFGTYTVDEIFYKYHDVNGEHISNLMKKQYSFESKIEMIEGD